jgi:hypothetical protein
MPDEKMRQYSSSMSDEQVKEWDGNFKSDGDFMILCSERDVDVAEYREVLEQCMRYRDRVRAAVKA